MSVTLEPLDLTSCDREVIHAPGSIQPHGMMLVAGADDLRVQHVAGGIEHRLGVATWDGQPLAVLLGDVIGEEIAALAMPDGLGGFMGQLRTSAAELLDVTAHRSGSHIIVELETASVEGLPASRVIDRVAVAAAGFQRATSMTAVCERAVVEFRRLTRFDRVMVYRFLDNAAGVVRGLGRD